MKKSIVAALLTAMFSVCLADSDTPITIKTLDGQVYENAVVEGVHPGGIDIGFVNSKGYYVLKGLSFSALPDNIRKQYGYNPAENTQFESQVKSHEKDDPNNVVENEKARLERITKEIKEKFAGQNIKIKPEDLRFAIYAKRLSVILNPISSSLTGCVAKIVELESGTPISSQIIQIDAAALTSGVNWSGFIYPTGLKTRYQGNAIPVYADSLDRAVVLANHYLDIYSEYAAEGGAQQQTAATNAEPPDQDISQQLNQPQQPQDQSYAQNQQPQQSQDQSQQYQQPQQSQDQSQQYQQSQQQYQPQYADGSNNYYPNYNGGYYYPGYAYAYGPGFTGGGCYFIGGNYGPVNWWNNRHYPHNNPNGPHRYYNPNNNPNRPNVNPNNNPNRPNVNPNNNPNRPNVNPNNRYANDNNYRPGSNYRPASQGGGINQGMNNFRSYGDRMQWSGNPSNSFGGRSFNQGGGGIQTSTHYIQRAGNFRRAEPR